MVTETDMTKRTIEGLQPGFSGAYQKGPEFAREIIATLESDCKNRAARKRMAEMALRRGNYSDAGLAVWRDYLGTF